MLVDSGIEGTWAGHAGLARDDRDGAARLDMVEDGVGVIGFVGDHMPGAQAFEQRESLGGVVDLTTGEEEAQRSSERVHGEVPLAGQSSSGTPQSLVFDPPFWPVAAWAWARTIALSIIRYSLSRSLVSAWNTRSHTPA